MKQENKNKIFIVMYSSWTLDLNFYLKKNAVDDGMKDKGMKCVFNFYILSSQKWTGSFCI